MQLEKFIGLVNHFNNGHRNGELNGAIRTFFNNYWEHDKLTFLKEENGSYFFEQLDRDLKLSVYKNFIFNQFLHRFRKLFCLRMDLAV